MQGQSEETLRKGEVVGRYRVIERVGAGGMGDVYRARDLDLERDVALKVLPADVVNDEERVRRFVQEAKSASALNHPNIVTVYEAGKTDVEGRTVHYIAMELVDDRQIRAMARGTANTIYVVRTSMVLDIVRISDFR